MNEKLALARVWIEWNMAWKEAVVWVLGNVDMCGGGGGDIGDDDDPIV